MAETHQAELARDPAQSIVVTDPEPLASARLFKFVSDEVWKQIPENEQWSVFGIPSVLPAPDALAAVNEVVQTIDDKLVIAGGNKNLSLGVGRGERVRISKATLAVPEDALLETYNWDYRWEGRQVKIDGERFYAHFTDGHHDYARELSAGFHFRPKGRSLAVSYTMQRYQYGQGNTTQLHSHVWYSGFAEQGYEGNILHSRELTEAQEIDVLNVFASIGGIATKGFTTK